MDCIKHIFRPPGQIKYFVDLWNKAGEPMQNPAAEKKTVKYEQFVEW